MIDYQLRSMTAYQEVNLKFAWLARSPLLEHTTSMCSLNILCGSGSQSDAQSLLLALLKVALKVYWRTEGH